MNILVLIVLIGFLVAVLPMDPRWKQLAYYVTVFFLVLLVLSLFSVIPAPEVRWPHY
jgi:hypothetical protein